MPSTWINGRRPGLLFTCLLMVAGLVQAQSPGQLQAGLFSAASAGESLPPGWQPLAFRRIERHTEYSLVEAEGTIVVKALSNSSASGLTRTIAIDPAAYPVIQWRWKVDNVLGKGNVRRKDGDDYPARIYISFAFDPDRSGYLERLEYAAARLIHGEDVPYRAISYIWGSNSRAGTMIPNPYTDRVMMFVVQGGKEQLQRWVTEERNVYEDYKKAFGEEPAMISGVAIMTDTDDTRETAVAWYGDIVFRED